MNAKRNPLATAIVATLLLASLTAASRGESATWSAPDIDTWVYPNAFVGAGSRLFAPTFGVPFAVDPDTNALERGDATRLASFVFAFETLDDVPAGLSPDRYAINTVTVTATSERGQGGNVVYRTEPVTPASVLADVQSGDVGGFPIELFGVGFTDAFDGFALGADRSGSRFAESDQGWVGGDYTLFPTDADGRRDAVNNINGGFSATESTGETDPFVATPFAIGTVPGANEGDPLPNDTAFVFDLDLTNPGVVDYVQHALSDGVVGFAISSLQSAQNPTGSPIDDPLPYPQWYTKEAVPLFPNAAPPTLTIDFDILPIAGDFNDDGAVDTLDYDAWVAAFGSSDALADGNRDGRVDGADFTVWRDAFAAAAIPVPEPNGRVYALAIASTIAFCYGTVVFTRPRRPR